MATRLTGAPVASKIYAQVREKAAALGTQPCLAAVSVGAQPDDRAYLRSIARSADGCGVAVRPVELPADCTADALTGTLRFAPCTAEACLHLLRAYGFDPAGRRVTVVGRSLVIGRPAALLLTRADATVTLCHRKTPGLAARCREADILLAAAGAPGLITPACVHPEQIVLDAGVTALPDGTLLGDVAAEAAGTVAACTPVPGGIGSVTTSSSWFSTEWTDFSTGCDCCADSTGADAGVSWRT